MAASPKIKDISMEAEGVEIAGILEVSKSIQFVLVHSLHTLTYADNILLPRHENM